MNLWPEVRATERQAGSPEAVVLHLHVPHDLDYFEGHFPGLPVLPGVVQLHWAVRLAAEHLGQPCKGSRIDQLKFLAIVHPGSDLTLTLRLDRSARALHFAYSGPTHLYSSGRISIE
jgi:3-hydroxymyristoyl/3-hydroxydecanoyl-(acyl carrier protein) dehydratase